jgi:hypothetical protein
MFMAGEMDKDDIEYFLSIGALEFSCVNERGEEIYSLTDKAREIAPELYLEQMKNFNEIIFSLWRKDILEITFDEDGEPMISITKGKEEFDISDLDEEEQDIFEEILIAWNEKNKE